MPDLQISKTSPLTEVGPGGTISYTIRVRNDGSTTATDPDPVVVVDTLPPGFSLTSLSVFGGGFSANTATEGIITFTAPSLAENGVGIFTIRGIVPQGASGSITNQALVDPDNNIAEDDEFNNSASVVTTVNNSLGPDLEISKAGNTEVLPEGSITYTISVRNEGEADATDIVVRDTLPTGFSLVDVFVTDQFTADTSTAGLISFTGGVLESGQVAVLEVTGTAPATAVDLTLTNTVVVDPENVITEVSEDNNEAMVATTVTVEDPPPELTPDLTIFKSSDPEIVPAGETLSYELSVRNEGEGDATGIVVRDTLPPGFSLVDVFVTDDFIADTSTAGQVSFTGGVLASGQTALLTIEGIAPSSLTPLTNVAVVDPDGLIVESNEAGTAEDNNTATATTNIGLPDLVIFKFGDPPGDDLEAGDSLSYTIIVRNDGNAATENITVVDNLPGEFLLDTENPVVIQGDFTADTSVPGSITFTGGSLAVDQIAILTINGTVAGGGNLINTAIVDPANMILESDETNNTDTFTSGAQGPTLVYVDDDWASLALGTRIDINGDGEGLLVDIDGDTLPDSVGPNDATFGIDAFPTIQDGEQRVASDGTGVVQVFAGTYTEKVGITKPLTLNGPNAGIDPTDPGSTRVDEAVITGTTNRIEFFGEINNLPIVIDGFAFEGLTGGTNINQPAITTATTEDFVADDITIQNNIFRTLDTTAINFSSTQITQDVSILNNLIEDINSTGGARRAMFLQNIDGLTVSGNTIRNVIGGDNPGILLDTVTGIVLIEDNQLTTIASQGIQVAGITGGGTVTINNNELIDVNVGADGIVNSGDEDIANAGIRLRDSPFGATLNGGTVDITNNRVENTMNGLVIRDNADTSMVTVTNNFFFNTVPNPGTPPAVFPQGFASTGGDAPATIPPGPYAIIHDGVGALNAASNFNNTIAFPLTEPDIFEFAGANIIPTPIDS